MSEQSPQTTRTWSAVLFDLDGTLTDSAPGITESLAAALEEVGHPVSDPDSLTVHVGPPLHETLASFGLTDGEVEAAVAAYRSRADFTDLHGNAVFPGMLGLLHSLREAGIPIALATSKPTKRATRILEHFGLLPYFDVVGGSPESGHNTTKADVIRWVSEQLAERGVDTSHLVMIGDRGHDVLGAEANDVPSIVVEWGYGSPVEAVGAMAVVHSVDQLRNLLIG
ncbi:HAD hydrolase-like protein [Planctomonas sp. JC2975]|uniref:HAD hydrolase-like protein n=1 Tax=Planctomonas sp. JC2975 TaxID=2729626 RepID=UPI00147544C1|nr:HAD hydrolase-like protein [Planctomonas sp. JC2975]NNC12650.1 HAD hydrolase-like protein [Planctomonas sp. JC2975]